MKTAGRSIFKRAKTSGSDLQSADGQQLIGKYDEKLFAAADKGDLAAFKSAMKKGGSFFKKNGDGVTPLHYACHHGRFTLVKYMMEVEPSSVTYPDSQDRTPAHHASKSGNLLCLQQLKQGSADNRLLQSTDAKMLTPLHYAAFGGHLSVVKYLCEQKCPTSPPDVTGLTPLIFAAAGSHLPVVRELLDNNADINFLDENGKTALMWACERGATDTVDLLLRRGARVDLADKSNKTAADLAVENGFQTIRDQLEAAPKVASWELGVQPGSRSSAVLIAAGSGVSREENETLY